MARMRSSVPKMNNTFAFDPFSWFSPTNVGCGTRDLERSRSSSLSNSCVKELSASNINVKASEEDVMHTVYG